MRINPSLKVWPVQGFKLFSLVVFTMLFFLPQHTEAKKFNGLKVHGDHRILEPIVSEIPPNRSGVTRSDVLSNLNSWKSNW